MEDYNDYSERYINSNTSEYTNKNLEKIRKLADEMDSLLIDERMRLDDINHMKENIVSLNNKRESQLRELQTERASIDALKQQYITEKKQFEQQIENEKELELEREKKTLEMDYQKKLEKKEIAYEHWAQEEAKKARIATEHRIKSALQAEFDQQKKELQTNYNLLQQKFKNHEQKTAERENELLQKIEELKTQLTKQQKVVIQQKDKYEMRYEELYKYIDQCENTFKNRESELKKKIEELELNTDYFQQEKPIDFTVGTTQENVLKYQQEPEELEFNAIELDVSDEEEKDPEIREIIQFIKRQEEVFG